MRWIAGVALLSLVAVAWWVVGARSTAPAGLTDVAGRDPEPGPITSPDMGVPGVAGSKTTTRAQPAARDPLVGGVVLSEDGTPIGEVAVATFAADRLLGTTLSRADGTFSLDAIADPSGPVDIVVRASRQGWLDGEARVRVGDAAIVVLVAATRVELTVRSRRDGRPIAAVAVAGDAGLLEVAVPWGTTGPDGRLTRLVPASVQWLHLSAPGYESLREPGFSTAADQVTRTILLDPIDLAWLAVTDETGAEVSLPAFARVAPGGQVTPVAPSAIRRHPPDPAVCAIELASDDVLEVTAAGLATRRVGNPEWRASSSHDPLRVQLGPEAVLLAELQAAGRPVAGRVQLQRLDALQSWAAPWLLQQAAADGIVRVVGLARGASYRLLAGRDGAAMLERLVDIAPDVALVRLGVLDVDASQAGWLDVEVRDADGAALAGCRVALRANLGLATSSCESVTDHAGRARMSLPAGPCELVLEKAGLCREHRIVEQPGELVVTLAAGMVLQGVVVDERGLAVPFASLMARANAADPRCDSALRAQSALDGTFAMPGACAGEYSVLAAKSGYLETSALTDARPGEALRLVLPRAGVLEVELRPRDATAPDRPWTFEVSRDGRSSRGHRVAAGATMGRAPVPAGSWQVRVIVDGCAPVLGRVEVDPPAPSRLVAAPEPGCVVDLRAIDAGAAPIAGIELSVRSADPGLVLEADMVTTDEAGQAMTRLMPGTWRVEVASAQWRVASDGERFAVTADATILIRCQPR